VNFKDEELRCKCGCGLLKLNRGFRDALEDLRNEFKRPMVLTSAVRCSEHNEAVGGHVKSLHVGDVAMHPGQTGALAVDVATPDGVYRGQLFSLAWKHGFSIGWNAKRRFLHLDRRVDVGLPQTSFDY
jgi:hypothetical protein